MLLLPGESSEGNEEDDQAEDDAVHGKPGEPVSLDEAHENSYDGEGDDEGNGEAQAEQRDLVGLNVFNVLHQRVPAGGEHGRNRKKERELGGGHRTEAE